MAITGNKGEWSEIYALFKLLGEKQMYAGDENHNRIEDIVYPILSVLRRELDNNRDTEKVYDIVERDIVVVSIEREELVRIPCSVFLEQSRILLEGIKQSQGSSFSLPDIEQFMSEVSCTGLKAKSVDKSDIRIVIHDPRTGVSPLLGFSIKSQLGAKSTLINAGSTTNIVYKIEDLEMTEIVKNQINSINRGDKMDLIGRVRYIYEQKGKLVFHHYQNDILCKNLMMIDTILPEIIQKMLLNFYLTDARTVIELIKTIEDENFIRFDLADYPSFYRRKVANMLVDAALGMVPKTKWNGQYDATGGYLVVKEDGELLCYHFYNRNLFEQYLLNNTAFETPGKHEQNNFGLVYSQNNDYYMNLELQVRFLQ